MEQLKFKVGDTAIVTTESEKPSSHKFKIGQSVLVKEIFLPDQNGIDGHYMCTSGDDFWFMNDTELKPVEE